MALAAKQNRQTGDSTENGLESNNNHVIIKIPDNLESFWPIECCIYRIAPKLRDINKEAYAPQWISIGPMHHGEPKLARMENYKYIYLQNFLDRSGKKLETFLDFIGKEEKSIRRCYSEPFDEKIDSKEYVKMILLDAFFIFELFIRNEDRKNDEYKEDPLLRKPWLDDGIQLDLIILENQLPFSNLVALYNFAFNYEPKKELYALVNKYFRNYDRDDQNVFQDMLHFTDLVRKKMLKKPKSKPSNGLPNLKVAANKLSEAGIKFENATKTKDTKEEEDDKNNKEQDRLNLVSFDKHRGVLKLPHFEVDDTTECLYRNLMALEQCQYPDEAYICSYIMLMDDLINSKKDVALLVKKGIISNGLGCNKAVAGMVNNLCRNILYNDFYYKDIYDGLNGYCDSWLHRCVAVLNGEYFKNVWHGTGTVVGIIVLMLTFINLIWSIMRIIGVKVD